MSAQLSPFDLARPAALRRLGGPPRPLARVVMFTWCGAGASAYRRLAAELGAHLETHAVQLPGREDRFREPHLRRMDTLAGQLADEIAALADRPLLLFGHSMGALVAYEVARRLEQTHGVQPRALIASGHGAPDHASAPLSSEARMRWHTADDSALIANIARIGGTPPELLRDGEMLRTLVPTMRADYEILETYEHRAGPALACPIVACAGVADREVSLDGMAGWARFSADPGPLLWFPGDHFYLNTRPAELVRAIETWSLR